MGRPASNLASDHPVAGLTLPPMVGTGTATPYGQKGAGGPIEGAWFTPAEPNLRPLHAAAPGHLHGPPPEGRDAAGLGRYPVRRLVQRGARRRVAGLAE